MRCFSLLLRPRGPNTRKRGQHCPALATARGDTCAKLLSDGGSALLALRAREGRVGGTGVAATQQQQPISHCP